jgi:hypothetical protein
MSEKKGDSSTAGQASVRIRDAKRSLSKYS